MIRLCRSAGLLMALLLAQPAAAGDGGRPVCGERERILRQLAEEFGETRRSRGLARGGGVVEIFANARSGSWTIVVTGADGVTCLLAAGEGFEIAPAADLGRPI